MTRALSYIVTCFYFFEFIGEKTNFFDRFCQKSVYIILNYRLFPAVIETEYSSGFVQICNGTLLSVGGGTGKKSLVFQEFCTFCTGFCTVCPVQRIIAYSEWLVYITTHQEFLRIVQYFPGTAPAVNGSHFYGVHQTYEVQFPFPRAHFFGQTVVFLKKFCKKRKKLLILRHLPAIIYFCMKKNTRFYIPSP